MLKHARKNHQRKLQTPNFHSLAIFSAFPPFFPVGSSVGERKKNKYIKMPAGKMKIQTNALIRDAGALLENVSRSWLLLLVLLLTHSFRCRTKPSKGG